MFGLPPVAVWTMAINVGIVILSIIWALWVYKPLSDEEEEYYNSLLEDTLKKP